MSCGVGCRHGSDPTLLWMWYRPIAVALIRPLAAWELPYAVSVGLKCKKKREREREEKKEIILGRLTFLHKG